MTGEMKVKNLRGDSWRKGFLNFVHKPSQVSSLTLRRASGRPKISQRKTNLSYTWKNKQKLIQMENRLMVARCRDWGEKEMGEGGEKRKKNNHFTKTKTQHTAKALRMELIYESPPMSQTYP